MSHVRVHQQKSGSNIKPILIAGGFTSRIGSPKHFLPNTDGRLLYQHTFEELNQALPHVTTVYSLLRNESKFSDTHALHAKAPSLHLEPLYDTISISIGPAAALLAAHTHSPTITWLVVTCDHLLLTAEALQNCSSRIFCLLLASIMLRDSVSHCLGSGVRKRWKDYRTMLGKGAQVQIEWCREMRRKVVVPTDKRRLLGADTPEDCRRQRALRETRSKIFVDFLASKERITDYDRCQGMGVVENNSRELHVRLGHGLLLQRPSSTRRNGLTLFDAWSSWMAT